METDFESQTLKDFLNIPSYAVHTGFISAPAVPVHQLLPESHHFFMAIVNFIKQILQYFFHFASCASL